jgi:hypothetical protein
MRLVLNVCNGSKADIKGSVEPPAVGAPLLNPRITTTRPDAPGIQVFPHCPVGAEPSEQACQMRDSAFRLLPGQWLS